MKATPFIKALLLQLPGWAIGDVVPGEYDHELVGDERSPPNLDFVLTELHLRESEKSSHILQNLDVGWSDEDVDRRSSNSK